MTIDNYPEADISYDQRILACRAGNQWKPVVIEALTRSGWTQEDIDAAVLSMCQPVKSVQTKRRTSPNTSFTSNRKNVDVTVIERFKLLWQQSTMSLDDIASAMQLSLATTRRMAKDLDLQRRKPGRKKGTTQNV
jgi:hypothetical protein